MAKGKCRSCQADILWVVMAKTGKKNPLDFEPSDKGNVFINERGKGIALTATGKAEIELRFGKVDLRLSHFATCPNAKQHKKPA